MRVNPVRLQQAMNQAKLNQKMLADIMGVQPVTISRWINGNRGPHKCNLMLMAQALHVDPEYLTGEDTAKLTETDSLLSVIGNIQAHADEWSQKQKMGLIKLLCDFVG